MREMKRSSSDRIEIWHQKEGVGWGVSAGVVKKRGTEGETQCSGGGAIKRSSFGSSEGWKERSG